eukprot:tig00020927_g15960.t1
MHRCGAGRALALSAGAHSRRQLHATAARSSASSAGPAESAVADSIRAARLHLAQGLNAFTHIRDEEALAEARELDRAPASSALPLRGFTVAVKDNFCVRNTPTTAASRMLKNFVAPYDATVVKRLRDAGAVVIGKTNMDEFGMGSFNMHSVHGPCYSPLAPRGEKPGTRLAGGSSGGSAAAVAAGACRAALASDTGGSVRLPAAFCGVVGLKPTYGRVSRHGLIAYGSSLDCPSIVARSVEDAALLLDAVAGPDEMDPTCVDSPAHEAAAPSLSRPLAGLTVGIPAELHVKELPEPALRAWRAAAGRLRAAGARVAAVSLPHTRAALPAYYILASAEASSNLARYDGVRYGHREEGPPGARGGRAVLEGYAATRSAGFGPEVRRRILTGVFVLSSSAFHVYYERAQRVRALVARDFEAAFAAGVDLLLCPAAVSGPPTPAAAAEEARQPARAFLADVMTIPASLAGLPAASLPVPGAEWADGLPVSVQLPAAALKKLLYTILYKYTARST